MITFEDFQKIELKVGTVVNIEEVPKAKKILKLTVSFGAEKTRTVMAGIKEFFQNPQVLMNQQYVFVTNLEPREMFGEKSEAMILATKDFDSRDNDTGCMIVPNIALMSPTLHVNRGAKLG